MQGWTSGARSGCGWMWSTADTSGRTESSGGERADEGERPLSRCVFVPGSEGVSEEAGERVEGGVSVGCEEGFCFTAA